jgi:formylglycine-generating enzyme required for sulfatase activity
MHWDETQQFCVKLSERLGKRCRLPTEAEWEYACRAGTTSPFHFGTVFSSKLANANNSEPYGSSRKGRSLGRPTPIGHYPANPWGLHDMHGNVWEWCQDIKALYPVGPQTDPLQTEGSESHVFRGGSWDRAARCCRAAYRDSASDDYQSSATGLRVCLEA